MKLENEIRRIHELRRKVEHDVAIELKQLDEMGDLSSIQKPAFLLNNLSASDLTSEDTILTLNDIYQFLQFGNDFEEQENPALPKSNYRSMETELLHKISTIQHTTVGKILKRILVKPELSTEGTQTPFNLREEELKIMREEMENLYKDKTIMKQELLSVKNDAGKYRSQLQNSQNEINELIKENKRLSRGLNTNAPIKRQDTIDNSGSTKLKEKMNQYKEIVKKRDAEIKLLSEGTHQYVLHFLDV